MKLQLGWPFLFLFAVSSSPAGSAQSDVAQVEIEIRQITNNVYMLTGTRGVVGNIAMLTGPEGILLVDSGYQQLAGKIVSAIRRISSAPIRFVINTHSHEDHVGANPAFAAKGATVIAQANVRKRLAEPSITNTLALPMVSFDRSLTLHLNGEEIRLVHYGRGHTDSDCIVHFVRANVVHMGDHFFNFGFPFVDLENGGSVDGYIRTIAEVLESLPQDAKIIPGHGPLATVADLNKYHQMLVETAAAVRKAKVQGKTLDEIKRTGLPKKWRENERRHPNADFWIETVYRDVSRD